MIWKILWLFLTDRKSLRAALIKIEQERAEKEFERRQNSIRLCKKHQPANPGTVYASHNCDVCKLHKQLKGQLEH